MCFMMLIINEGMVSSVEECLNQETQPIMQFIFSTRQPNQKKIAYQLDQCKFMAKKINSQNVHMYPTSRAHAKEND